MAVATLLDQLPAALSAHLVPARRLEAQHGVVATALPRLDALLGGGWPRGAVSELAGPRSSGRTSLLLASLAGVLSNGGAAVLVDAEQAFDPRCASRAGVPLDLLLWVHAPGQQSLRAAELLVNAGGFDLVAVDIGDANPRVPDASWVRLRHAAERQRTAVLVVATSPLVRAFAGVAMMLTRRAVDFGERRGARRTVTTSSAAAPALLTALRSEAAIARRRSATTACVDSNCCPLEFSVLTRLPDNDTNPQDRGRSQTRRKR